MVPPAILPSPAVLCGECLPTELGNEQRKYPPCFPQGSGVAAQSLGLFGLQLWEVEAAEPRDVWEGWRSHGAFGGNSCVHLGPLPAGGINPLQFHLPLAAVRGRLKNESCWGRGGWESPRCHNHERTLHRNSGIWLWKLWQGQVLAWGGEFMVRVIFLLPGGFGKTEAPEHLGGMCGLVPIASKVGMAP